MLYIGMDNSIYRAAWEHHVANPDRSTPVEENRFFIAYVMGQEKPQTYRYLRKVLGEKPMSTYWETKAFFVAQLRVMARNADSLDLAADLAALGSQLQDLEIAFKRFREVLSERRDADQQPDSSGVSTAADGAKTDLHSRGSGRVSGGQAGDDQGVEPQGTEERPAIRNKDTSGVEVQARGASRKGATARRSKGGAS